MSADSRFRQAGSALPGLLLKLAGSALLTVLLLAVVEWVAGLFVEPRVAREIVGDAVSRTVTYIEVNPAPLARDANLLWRNEPNARKTQAVNPRAYGTSEEWTLENNSRGYRGPEVETPKGKRFRILCVGDSITFGFSVDQPDTWPQQLGALLAGRYPDRTFEVINAAVPGWSWLQGLRFLELEGLALEPDVVVIGHGTNDQLFFSKVTDEERFNRLARRRDRILQNLAATAAETNIYRALTKGRPLPPDDEPSPGCKAQIEQTGKCRRMSLDQITTAVYEIVELGTQSGVDLLVANTDFARTPAIRGLRPAVDALHVPFVDLVDAFTRRREEDENERARRLGLEPSVFPTEANMQTDKVAVLRVVVPDASLAYRVEGMGLYRPDLQFAEPLHDDGTHGDERAGDGVFSATVTVPKGFSSIVYKYFVGETAEFAALPPLTSTLGDRVLHTPDSRKGPVDVFGQSLFMVERAHPNREGHRLNAWLIADKLEELAAFREYVKGARRVDGPAASPAN